MRPSPNTTLLRRALERQPQKSGQVPVWGKGVFHEFKGHPGVRLVAATEQHFELQARLRPDLSIGIGIGIDIERIYTDQNEMP